MNIQNEFKLTVPSNSVNEAFCRVVISSFITPLDPTIEELNDVKTAVSEAVTNCIVHAYGQAIGRIYIEGSIYDNKTVKIVIKDKGVGIKDIKAAMQPLYTTGDGDRAGLGFTVMQSFCDRVSVKSSTEKGTKVTLTKRITGRSRW